MKKQSIKNAGLVQGNFVYRNNMQILRKKYPGIADLMDRTALFNYEVRSTGITRTANLLMKRLGSYYYNETDPIGDTHNQLSKLNLKNPKIAVFLGFGLGHELTAFLRKAEAGKTAHFLFVEKDPEIFKAALHTYPMQQLFQKPNIHFLIGMPAEQLFPSLVHFFQTQARIVYAKALKVVYHESALRLNKEYYLAVVKAVKEAGIYQTNFYGNSPQDSLLGIENMLKNINEIVENPGINLLYNKFKGKPAIIVSTGPSLNKNKHLLKGLEDKALIICPDASLRVLLNMGIKPHLVTSLERTIGILKLMQGFDAEDVKEVYYAATPVIDKQVYDAYPGPRVIVYRNFDHFKWLNVERGTLDIKHSSGNMAFKLAEALGCDPVILIGQDLAFSPDGDTHAKGTIHDNNEETKKKLVARGTLEVRGNYVDKILTSNVWYNFLKAYEVDIAQFQGTCINSTEGGAYIEGTKLMPFQASIDKYIKESFNPLDLIKETLGLFTNENRQTDFGKVLSQVEKAMGDLDGMMELCSQGLQVYQQYEEQLKKCLANSVIPEELKRLLPTVEQEIMKPKHKLSQTKYHETYQMLVMHFIQSYYLMFEMEMNAIPEKFEDEELARCQIALHHSQLYLKVREMMRVLQDCLAKAKESLLAQKDGGVQA